MNAALIPHRRAALRLPGGPDADIKLQLAAVCHNEDIYIDKPMQYHAHTYDLPPRIVRSYPMDEFLFMPQRAHIVWQSTERVAKLDVEQCVQA